VWPLGEGAGEVGGLDALELAAHLRGGAGEDDAAALEDVDAIGDGEGLTDVLLDQDDAEAGVGGFADGA
jgi:hypothetical protein